jgi:type II secretion system protein N
MLVFAGSALFLIFLYLFFPVSRVNVLLNKTLSTQGLSMSPGAHKTVLPGLAWDESVLATERGALLRFNHLGIRPQLTRLLAGRLMLQARASLASGTLFVDYGLTGNQALTLAADQIRLDEVPLFQTVLAGKAAGILRSNGSIRRSAKGLDGEIQLEVKQLELSGVKLGGFALPDVSRLASQGMIRVTAGQARLESFTIQGNGIHMRLSGDLPMGAQAATAPLNMMLEIMPKPEFLDSQKLVFLLLAKFMTSPGVYRIPVRGTLLKPEII